MCWAGGAAGGVDVVWVDRGGQTTLHSPGQMILYPIVKLGGGSLAGPRMTHALLEGLRAWLIATHGVEAEIPRGRPGLFIGDRKLMSIGISVRGGVSMHGIAMNLCNDPALWDRIVACGEPGTRPVTLSELLGRRIEPKAQGGIDRTVAPRGMGLRGRGDRVPRAGGAALARFAGWRGGAHPPGTPKQFAAAVGAASVHTVSAVVTESTFVAADVGLALGFERG
jgi:lipoate-protein ligase B